MDQDIEHAEKTLACIEWVGMKNAYKTGDMSAPADLLQMLHEKYLEVYGTDHIDSCAGMVTVPGVVQAADGNNLLHLVNKYMDLWKAEPDNLAYLQIKRAHNQGVKLPWLWTMVRFKMSDLEA